MTMITPSYLGETIEYSSLHACRSTLEDPTDPDATVNPAMRSLLDQGLAQIDPLRIGIEVAPDCAIVNRRGASSRRLFAVGPLTRAAFWEISAVPDIRNQCVQLAERLIKEADRASYPVFSPPTVPRKVHEPRARAALVGHH